MGTVSSAVAVLKMELTVPAFERAQQYATDTFCTNAYAGSGYSAVVRDSMKIRSRNPNFHDIVAP